MKQFNRIFVIVMDSVGIGEAPDAVQFGDVGTHTLGNIAKHQGGIKMPVMERLGLGNLGEIQGVATSDAPGAHHMLLQEVSAGKDTMTGHWEMMGLRIDEPFLVFPDGFPDALIHEFERRTGRGVIGNKPASGTEILDELGEEHVRTGKWIVYTSADSVFQIAAHEDVVPLDELYKACEIARELTLKDPYMLGRVIARPFVGTPGEWKRTPNRHDYALKPFGRTAMDELKDNGYDVISIGKISDIFDGEGITESIRTVSNSDGMEKINAVAERKDWKGFCFLNLVDFDALYGHRRDPKGYREALETFDEELAELLPKLNEDDLLFITADHGNDPTHTGTDHTREYVPLIAYSPRFKSGVKLPTRETFADVGATIVDNFGVPKTANGTSFLQKLK
ncbi:MAG: phosphopentomutase [Bacilli bacterium]